MAGSSRYKASSYLRTIRGGDENDYRRFGGRIWNAAGRTVVYHSLFGNARAVDENVVSTLQWAATEGVSLGQLEANLPGESLRELMTTSMLVPEERDERKDINALRAARRRRLASGALLNTLQLVLINSCNVTCEFCFAYNADGSVTQREGVGGDVPRSRLLPLARKPDTRQVGCGLLPGDGRVDGESAPDVEDGTTRAMPFSVAARSVRHAVATRKDNGGDDLTVHLFGAEPTLHRNLIKQLLAQFRNSYDGVTISWQVTTNGSYLPQDLLDVLVAVNAGVEVSVDYICPDSGGYRGGVAQSTRWSTVQANIHRLLAAGLEVSISSVLSADTWDYWNHSLIDFAAAMGIEFINVVVAFQPDFFARYPAPVVAERLLAAYDHAHQRGVRLSGYWYRVFQLLAGERSWDDGADHRTCPAVGAMVSVEPTGSVHSCTMTNRYIGEISDWSGVFASEAYADYATRAYRGGPSCTGCELEGSCSAGAVTSARRGGESHAVNRGYCEYIRTVVDGLLHRHLAAPPTPPGDLRPLSPVAAPQAG